MAFLLHRLARHQRRGLGDTCCLHMGSWLERDGRNKHLTISSQTRRSSTVPEYIIRNDHLFLQQVEATVRRVFAKYSSDRSLSDVPIPDREMVAIARSLEDRIQVFRHYNNCPRCWLHQANCICPGCPPVEGSHLIPKMELPFRRVFVLTCHKEILMTVDTAKLILAAFPDSSRLVIGGIGEMYQETMRELIDALNTPSQCLVLYPSEDSQTFSSIVSQGARENADLSSPKIWMKVDLIILDGTWDQARRLYRRYLQGDKAPACVKLTEEALNTLVNDEDLRSYSGRQLRRHPSLFREISTVAAFRLLLADMTSVLFPEHLNSWDILGIYQEKADNAAKRQRQY